MFHRVAIIGLGLIGGSIGLALRSTQEARQVVGYDPAPGAGELARRVGAVDLAHSTLTDTVYKADLIILATPVGAMRSLLSDLAIMASPGTVITDAASTKSQVISWAEEFLPTTISFVGGHPMAGKETSGVGVADATLFQNCMYCLTPTEKTSPAALKTVSALAEILGAHVLFLDPVAHDNLVSQVSHLPFLVSTALMNTLANKSSWKDAALLASSGFRDTTRLAAGSPEMYRDICLTNSEAIVSVLDEYIETLQTFRAQIASHDPHIQEPFTCAQQARQRWQNELDLREK